MKKKSTTVQADPHVLAVLHRGGKVWRGLIANIRGPRPVFVAARDFPPDRVGRLDEWLSEHRVASALCVLPASAVICRNASLPDAPAEQLEQALHLQAEAHLLGIAPSHRLAMTVLPSVPGETSRCGVVLAWPEAAAFDAPPVSVPKLFVPDVAAIAALLNGQRPTHPVLWLDRADGSIALALSHAGGVMLRATREDADSPDVWQSCVSRTVAESALSVGHTAAFVEDAVGNVRAQAADLGPQQAGLFLPDDLQASAASRVEGIQADRNWWQQYGIAVGALLARTGPLAGLTRMELAPPVQTPSRLDRVANQLSRPKTALATVLACALILMFGPPLVSGLRLAILQARFGDIHQQLESSAQVKHQLAMYKELERQKAWPMTKLLSDIATNTPLGIELSSIKVDAGKDFSVSGEAIAHDGLSATKLVLKMQDNLLKSGLFRDVFVNWGAGNNLGTFKFDLQANIAKPYQVVNYPIELDFAKWTHQMRREGVKPGESKAVASAPSTEKPLEAPVETPAEDPQVGSTADAGADAASRPGSYVSPRNGGPGDIVPEAPGVTANPRVVPPPLDPNHLASMSRSELQKSLSDIAKAREIRDLDEETKNRLKQEWDMVLAQLRK